MHRSQYFTQLFSFKTFNAFDYCLIGSILAISIGQSLISGRTDVIGTVSAICGVMCVVLGAKGSMANWIFGIVECFLYTYICLQGHIYGDAMQRLFYTLPMQFLGWRWWHRRRRADSRSQIRTRYMTWPKRLTTVAVIAFFTVVIAMLLSRFGDVLPEFLSKYILPGRFVKHGYTDTLQLYMDSFTTVVSIVTMFISTRAYVEQWMLWIFVNIVSALMWYKNLDSGDPHAFMTVCKYVVYLVNSFYGLYMWRKLSRD
jgi:nicotinamide mononucleotide transporter